MQRVALVQDQTVTVYQNRVLSLWFWVSFGVRSCGLFFSPPFNFNIMFCTHSVGGGLVMVCCACLSNSCNNTGNPVLLSWLTPLVTHSSSSSSPPCFVFCLFFPHKSHNLAPAPSSLCRRRHSFCRSPVCGVPAESEDSHVEPRSHAARGQAHVFRIPPAAASLWRHQGGVLP